jgi:hypothetical protein
MNDDLFFERLRKDAWQLRYDADDIALTRLSARVRERVAAPPPSVALFLARWFRPLAASLAALAIAATIGVEWYASAQQQQPNTIEAAMSADPVEISMDGNTFTLSH